MSVARMTMSCVLYVMLFCHVLANLAVETEKEDLNDLAKAPELDEQVRIEKKELDKLAKAPDESFRWMMISRMMDMENIMNKVNFQMNSMRADIEELKNGQNLDPAVDEVTPLNPVNLDTVIGGQGGQPFNDSDRWNNKPVTGIRMKCGHVVISIQMKYGDRWGPIHGGKISRWCKYKAKYDVEAELDRDEYVIAANATHNEYINSLVIKTNERALRECGTSTGDIIKNIYGKRLQFISGRKGCYVDQLNLHWYA